MAQSIGNVTGITLSGNTLQLTSGTDMVVFQACSDNVIMVNLRPGGIKSPDTLVVGNPQWGAASVSIDTTSDPITIQTAKYRMEIARSPMRFRAYDAAGQLLCSEPQTGGINPAGIYLTTTGGNFYGLHNKRSGSLKLTTGGSISAGKQGEAGAPFVWTTKGWGILADVESGRIDYSATSVNFFRGSGSGSTNISWAPAHPTINDTITVSVASTKTGSLHWGVNYNGHTWTAPDSVYWPKGSTLYSDKVAVESPMTTSSQGVLSVKIGPFNNKKQAVTSLALTAHFSDNSWDNNSGNDYHIDFSSASDSIPKKVDIVFYLMFGSPKEIFSGMTDVTGKPPLFPKFTLGFINSQWGIDQTELLSMVSTYRAKGIPIDAFTLDFDWMDWGSDNYGEFKFGPKFPLAANGVLRDSLLKVGMKLTGIRKPRVHSATVEGQYAKAQNFFVDYVTDYFSGKQVGRMNFNKPDARQWYWNSFINQGNAYANGIVGYWNDEADEYGNNFNFLQMQRANYEGQRQYNNKRVWSVNRNFFLGAQRYAYGHWSGDIGTGFNTMAEQAPFMLSSILVGSSWWGMDIGGFNGHPSNDNYYRWIQFGAFVPIFRVHGTLNEKREPWFYGSEAEQIASQYIKLRYKLLPYIYTAAWQNHLTGLSIARPLVFNYPDDATATELTDEWMFGDNMLIKPVLTQNASTVSVYLPKGKWIDYWNGKVYTGPLNLNYSVSNSTMPIFVQAGAIIPTAPVGNYSNDPLTQKALILSCYPGDNGKSFVYDDDGETYQYETGAWATTALSQVQTFSYTELSIDARMGAFTPAQRDYIAEFNYIKNKPDSVSLNKTKLSQSTASVVLNTSELAWAYDAASAKCYVRIPDNGGANAIRLYGQRLTGVDDVVLPASYALSQNYPNPFNPTTMINYQIPSEGVVTMKVYNGLGQEIRTLVNENKAPGTYQVQFNATGLPSGMYFCQLRVNNFVSNKKMMLVK